MQVHLFIFIMAMVHILGGILLNVFASLRMRVWRRWEEADDAYAQQCAAVPLTHAISPWRAPQQPLLCGHRVCSRAADDTLPLVTELAWPATLPGGLVRTQCSRHPCFVDTLHMYDDMQGQAACRQQGA